MNRMIPLAIVVAAIIAAGAYFLMQGNVTEVEVTQIETPSNLKTQRPQPRLDMVLGDANAPITMIEYASYTCPHCGSFRRTPIRS